MSGREWKPGDVAMIELPLGGERIGVLIDDGGRCWHTAAHNGGLLCLAYDAVAVRPLAIIDPEARPQVERLGVSLDRHSGFENRWNEVRSALREFADPKPPCGVRLSVTYGDGKGHEQVCNEPKGHDGPHAADDFHWTAHYGEGQS